METDYADGNKEKLVSGWMDAGGGTSGFKLDLVINLIYLWLYLKFKSNSI